MATDSKSLVPGDLLIAVDNHSAFSIETGNIWRVREVHPGNKHASTSVIEPLLNKAKIKSTHVWTYYPWTTGQREDKESLFERL